MTDELSPSLGGPGVPVEVPAWPLRSSDPLVIFALPPRVYERRTRGTDLHNAHDLAMLESLRERANEAFIAARSGRRIGGQETGWMHV